MLNKKQNSVAVDRPYQCETRRQHFNHLRNTSVNMRNCLAWDQEQTSYQKQRHDEQVHIHLPKNPKQELDESVIQKRKVSFDAKQNVEHNLGKSKLDETAVSTKKNAQPQNKTVNVKQRPKSTRIQGRKVKSQNQDAEIRKQIRQKQLQNEAEKQQQKRQKVKKYVQELKPYTRSLTNSKYQDYFNKAAFESYGRSNVKNAIGGIIYGNHQKTFNMNPHIRGNQPKYYQTHYTSINYGKRTKLNEQDKWNRLEKELCKKLGLKDKNQTLKEGKQVVYVDVDDQTMHSVMKENYKFKKEHDEEIRALQKDYQKEIQGQKKAVVQQFYAKKRDRILTGNTIDSQQSTYTCDRDQRGRLQEQVIYRHTDKDGTVRLGADRHALTCFVDMNFPENDAAYTKQLCNRQQIYPIEVENKDRYIDDQRKANYQKSLQNIYPSHYLLPNCDQPQILKMINTKYGKIQSEKQVANRSKKMGSTFATTGVPNGSSLQVNGE